MTTLQTISNTQALINQLFSTRGADYSLEKDTMANNDILHFSKLKGIDTACQTIERVMEKEQRIVIVGDFDADGATATALLCNYFRKIKYPHVSYEIPNRFQYAYGLTKAIVEDYFANEPPGLIITVDNGISSNDGVAYAKSLGIAVVITDHHLPGEQLPEADAIINPNQHDCTFPSKHLAGVGVAYYLSWALDEHLKQVGYHKKHDIADVAITNSLDLVALGTIADVVPLDLNNRIMVRHGLNNIRRGHCRPGMRALIQIAKRSIEHLTSGDLAFAVAPRVNAAGRLDKMYKGVECLLSTNMTHAERFADMLNELNLTRKEVEYDMQQQGVAIIEKMRVQDDMMSHSLCLYHKDWHSGVIGILASRIKEMVQRPVVIFTYDKDGLLKGSSRSVPSVHIRDLMTNIDTLNPGLIQSYGGHSMAAGLSIKEEDFERFRQTFDAQIAQLNPDFSMQAKQPDCELSADIITLETIEAITQAGPWGQAFKDPVFKGKFNIVSQKVVGENHLKLLLTHRDEPVLFDAIEFYFDKHQWPNYDVKQIDVLYRLSINFYRGIKKVQLIIDEILTTDLPIEQNKQSNDREDDIVFYEA